MPTDIGASERGASMGPEALRVANLGGALRARGFEVLDRGNLVGDGNPAVAAIDGYRHLNAVTAWSRALRDAVHAEPCAGHVPLVMGGDHWLGVGFISAAARFCRENGKKLRVLWLDAHADFNTRNTSPTGTLHGMPVAILCGFGPRELLELSGQVPAIRADEIRLLGIRSVDPEEQRLVHEQGLEVFDMRYIDELGMRHTIEQALTGLDGNSHLHVSLDIDFLDRGIAPGVAATVPGGPTYREAQLCMEMIADTGLVGSLDVMEINPAYDDRNCTAQLAVDLIEPLFGKSTLMRAAGPRDAAAPAVARAVATGFVHPTGRRAQRMARPGR